MKNLDIILKGRDVILPAKVRLVKAMFFPVVLYGCENSTIKKAEPQRINAFELWCWRRLFFFFLEKTLESPLDCKEIKSANPKWNQSWIFTGRTNALNIHWNNWFWSWSSNNLATWFEELTHWKRPWRWERLKAGGKGDDLGWDDWMASPMDLSFSKLWELVINREAWHAANHGVSKSWTWLSHLIKVMKISILELCYHKL